MANETANAILLGQSPSELQAIAAFLSFGATVVLVIVYIRMLGEQRELRKEQRELRKLATFGRIADLQDRGTTWRNPEEPTSSDLRVRVANVGGHNTAIESVRLFDGDELVTEYPQISVEDGSFKSVAEANRTIHAGGVTEFLAGEGGKIDTRPDNPRVEIEPILGDMDFGANFNMET